MADAIGQVESIATIYGLQGESDSANSLNFISVLKNISEAVKNIHAKNINLAINNNLQTEYELLKDEAVPFALVLNELITNAIKHCADIEHCHPEINTESDGDYVTVTIKNKGQLPKNFHLYSNSIPGSGLKLVRSLLPLTESQFSLNNENEFVVARLTLDSQILVPIQENRPEIH
jgi:two-component sensor histidine kinase